MTAFLVPGVSAAALLPPSDFAASYDATTRSIHLSWAAPLDGSAPSSYNVYRNGAFLATVVGLSYDDTAPLDDALYTLTASASQSDRESAPALLFIHNCGNQCGVESFEIGLLRAVDLHTGTFLANCFPIVAAVYTQFPFVAAALREECLIDP